jgi:hypothetical protein
MAGVVDREVAVAPSCHFIQLVRVVNRPCPDGGRVRIEGAAAPVRGRAHALLILLILVYIVATLRIM